MLTVIDEGGGASPFLPPGVGVTPLVDVDGVIAKLECLNPCGSVKDRVAGYILRESRRRGLLEAGQPIVEATSGNTGIAFAYYGRRAGHPVTIVMPEHMTEERKALIRELDAELVLCSEEGSFAEAAGIRDEIAERTGGFNPDQFSNPLNVECHRKTTGVEIVNQLGNPAGPIAFVAGVGTGGTLIGVGAAMRDVWRDVALIAVEPAEAAVMSGGEAASHGIYGIGDGFVPEIASGSSGGLHEDIESVEVVSTAEAMAAAAELGQRHGLCVGVSSGANFVAAKRLKDRFHTVITVFPDGHHKYHSAGLPHLAIESCPFRRVCARSRLSELLGRIHAAA